MFWFVRHTGERQIGRGRAGEYAAFHKDLV